MSLILSFNKKMATTVTAGMQKVTLSPGASCCGNMSGGCCCCSCCSW